MSVETAGRMLLSRHWPGRRCQVLDKGLSTGAKFSIKNLPPPAEFVINDLAPPAHQPAQGCGAGRFESARERKGNEIARGEE